ncbi:hypothetical protein, partial [Marinomonas sp.]|uniref:hypothetical protein n=1 Tax=Marinomonas sp. TaxID=1904862 RepID=UPI003C70C15D
SVFQIWVKVEMIVMVCDCCITLVTGVSNDCPYWHSGHWPLFFQGKQTDKTQTYSVGNHHFLELALPLFLQGGAGGGLILNYHWHLPFFPNTLSTFCKDAL